MFTYTTAFSGFAVDNLDQAKTFYRDVLDLTVSDQDGLLQLHIGADTRVIVYPKPDHVPASFTILNFQVDDIDTAVDALVERGVHFERYPGLAADAKGIMRSGGPYIAWFKDPAGNILSVLQER
jgi:predicted enzyme related to lactoylglutathione lyase